MFNALSDFIIFCRVERRLSELTCKAYERDLRACVEFLRSQDISALVIKQAVNTGNNTPRSWMRRSSWRPGRAFRS